MFKYLKIFPEEEKQEVDTYVKDEASNRPV